LQKRDDEAEQLSIEAGQQVSEDHMMAIAILTKQTGVISKFNDSVTLIRDTTQRRSYIMQNSTQLLHDLLMQWTTIDPDNVDPSSVGLNENHSAHAKDSDSPPGAQSLDESTNHFEEQPNRTVPGAEAPLDAPLDDDDWGKPVKKGKKEKKHVEKARTLTIPTRTSLTPFRTKLTSQQHLSTIQTLETSH
jgi:hypothetical protein